MRHRAAAAELLEDPAQHRLDRREHILLRDEAHLDIELIEFAGAAVGARILVAETGRDLEIAVEARHHDELLELLRRLRQGVEFSRMQPGRHQKIARAFRARSGEDRRLELEKSLCLHARAEGIDDLPAQHDVLMQLFPAQIEESIAQPHVLGIVLLAEHGHRQFGGGSQNLDLGHIDFDEAGRHFGIFGARWAAPDRSVDPDHPFRAKLLGLGESRRIRIHHALGYAIMIAKIDEQDAAMIADTMAPAGETNRFAGVGFAQGAAAMGTVAVHNKVTSKRKG